MKWGNKIQKIIKADVTDFVLKLRFQNGTVATVSLGHIFDTPRGLAAEILKGGMFDKCFVESGAVAWPNGFELCPDALYQWHKEQRQSHRRAA